MEDRSEQLLMRAARVLERYSASVGEDYVEFMCQAVVLRGESIQAERERAAAGVGGSAEGRASDGVRHAGG